MLTMYYPDQAIDEGIRGTVIVNFRVETYGTVSDMSVTQGVHP